MPRTASDQPPITSPENPVVRHLKKVGRRLEPGLVLLEGPRVVREAAMAGIALELLAVREGTSAGVRAGRTVTLSRGLFRELSHTETPQGVLAVARAGTVPVAHALAAARGAHWPLVVLDRIQDPGNVGTIARTLAAVGAPAMAVLPGTADPYAPKAVRASAGNVFRLKVAAAAWSDLEHLRGVGAAASAGSGIGDVALETAEMLVLGSEAHGLTHPELDLVSIPMAEGVESLNVAAAAAVLLYEIRRRRHA